MVTIRFALFYEHQLPRPWGEGQELKLYQDALDQVEIADRVGFDYIWEVEHHFLEEYSHSSAPEVFLGAASQRTKRIRLGHGIVQLPPAINHPARIAERIATLDLVSNGRVDFGTGEASSSAELGGFGVRRTDKRAQWQDAIDAITRMFVEEPFAGWNSPDIRMPPRNVLPKTVQKPHPPLWVACSRRETIHFAARNGIGALSFSFVEPEDAGKWVDEYYRIIESEECVPAGFAVNPNVTVVLPMMLHEDEATAIERGIDGAHFFAFALAHYYGTTPHDPGRTDVWQEFLERRASRGLSREQIIANAGTLNVNVGSLRGAVGTPEQVIDLVRRYESAGVDQVAFVLQSGPNRHEHICESLELFGKAVLPHFTEGRDEREAAKAERLAPAVEAALARRKPARTSPPGYRIDEDAEVARARRASRGRRPVEDVRAAGRRRFRQGFYKLVHGRSDAQIERRFGPAAQRVFFAAMARAYDPSAAGGFTGELEFRLSRADEESVWTLTIGKTRARASQGPAKDPSLTLIVAAADFLRMLAGDANPASLLMDGRLELRGNFDLAPRLSEMFGGPSPY
ncbi:LLM class flavin-dependent oxidoreductase [Actinomadura sp. GC306]|uniref:LLM class flavin-dependent oxidoreductase n=1 Tax=Actinomadura sp. GC306 TaxID=2530367 RepID=UPI0010454135|nr:LLM class flavin-dependent oxidoreductase [Actinomadura sp. GC306]TDC70093.1 LLM class flavin-dependent oxidoreductase [Actinomadura sp. GC306]